MPISIEAPLSSEHALIALPVFVLLMKRVRHIITTMQVAIVIRVRYDTDADPREMLPVLITEGNTLLEDDQRICAPF